MVFSDNNVAGMTGFTGYAVTYLESHDTFTSLYDLAHVAIANGFWILHL